MTPDHRAVEIKSLLSFSFSLAREGPCEYDSLQPGPCSHRGWEMVCVGVPNHQIKE